jgi:hypothetical protein
MTLSETSTEARRRARPAVPRTDAAATVPSMLSNLGRREEALAASQKAVDIRRRLAQTRPDAFLPDLASSLGALSGALTAAERHGDAAAATHEGLITIAPFLEKHAHVFDNLARALGRDYLSACKEAGTEPDQALLMRVARTLASRKSTVT